MSQKYIRYSQQSCLLRCQTIAVKIENKIYMIHFTYTCTVMWSAHILTQFPIHVTNRGSLFIVSNWTTYSLSPKYYVDSLKIHPFSFAGICSPTYSPHVAGVIFVGSWTSPPPATFLTAPTPPWTHFQSTSTLQGECATISRFIVLF